MSRGESASWPTTAMDPRAPRGRTRAVRARPVLEQDESALGRRAGDAAVGGIGQDGGCGLDVDVGVLEQAHGELGPQDAAHGGIQGLDGDQAGSQGLGQPLVGGVVPAHLHVQAGHQSARSGVGQILGEVLGGQGLDSIGVRDDEALETEGSAQDIGQQPPIAAGGHAAQVHISAHDVAGPSVDGRLEGRQVDIPQFVVGDLAVLVVPATAGGAVAREVLGAGENATLTADVGPALEAAYLSGGAGRAQVRVLAGALDDATPAGVAGDIDHGGEGPRNAHGAGLLGGGGLRGLEDRGVP